MCVLRGLSSVELETALANMNITANVYPDNKIPQHSINAGIVNLDHNWQPGTHWQAFKRTTDEFIAFDSLGKPADDHIRLHADTYAEGVPYREIRLKLQPMNSVLCGHWCLWFLRDHEGLLKAVKGKTPEECEAIILCQIVN